MECDKTRRDAKQCNKTRSKTRSKTRIRTLWSEEEICEHFEISAEQLERYKKLPSFRAEVQKCLQEVKNSNSHIRHKAAAISEYILDEMVPMWLADPLFPPAEKRQLTALLFKTGRIIDDPVEKAKAEQEVAKNAPQVVAPTLNVFLSTGDNNPPTLIMGNSERVIEHEPTEDN